MQKNVGAMATANRGDREEELALFHEVRKREHERKSNAIHPLPPHEVDQPSPGPTNSSLKLQLVPSVAKMSLCYGIENLVVNNSLTADMNGESDDLLSAEMGKNDYDWLLTPPGTPLFNQSSHNPASECGDFLSRAEPFNLSIKTSRFSSTQTESNLSREGASLLKSSELVSRTAQNGVSRCNGLPSRSMSSGSLATKKTPLTPRSTPASISTSPMKRTPISAAQMSKTTPPNYKTKLSSAPDSHPVTPTSRHSAAMASKSGGNSVFSHSTTLMKMAPSSPGITSIKRLSPSQILNQPRSAGVSRSSSASKAGPQPSRSAPSSRGSSPRANPRDWQQALSSSPQSITTAHAMNPSLRLNHTAPISSNSRASSVGLLHRPGGTSFTRQALFPSSNQQEGSVDALRKARSPSIARGKRALLKMDKQSSAGLIMSRNSIQLDISEGESMIGNIKMEDKITQSRWQSMGSSVSSDIMCSSLKAKFLPEKYSSPTSSRDYGYNGHASRRSLDMSMQHLNLHRDSSNGLGSAIDSKPAHSFLSARSAGSQSCSNSSLTESNRNTHADLHMIVSCGQDGSDQGEAFTYRSDFKALGVDQTTFSPSLVKNGYMNWQHSCEHMNGGLDQPIMDTFDRGSGKSGSRDSLLSCPHGGSAVSCDLCSVKMRLQMLNEKSKASFGGSSQILGEA